MFKRLVYPLKYGYDSWKMLSHGYMLERCTLPRLTRENLLWSSLIQGAFHRIDMGDKKNIIDDDNVFLSMIEFS